MAWSKQGRQLPSNWSSIRQHILTRDPVCRCPGCPRCTDTHCRRPSVECDHIDNPNVHTDTNLRGLCRPCHARHTSDQAAAARGAGPTRRRPQPPHPGLKGGG